MSPKSLPVPARLRFGLFELDLGSNELTKAGRRVEVQGQPLRVIAVLAQNNGQVVTREEMRQQIWSGDTFVDFESGLRTALKKARQALGDSASNPRFIETLPRQGYRFIAPVTVVAAPELEHAVIPVPAPAMSPAGQEISAPTAQPEAAPREFWRAWLALAVILVAAISAWLWYASRPRPPVLDHVRPFAAAGGIQNRPAFSPSGDFLAFDWKGPHDPHTSIYIQKLDAPAPVRLTSGNTEDFRPVWSGDGAQIAFMRNSQSGSYSIYAISVVDRRERHIVDFKKSGLAWFDWSPDGKWFAVAEPSGPGQPTAIQLISAADGSIRTITAPAAGTLGDNQPAFSQDGSLVAFRRTVAGSGHEDLFVVPAGGGAPQRWTFDDRGIGGFAFASHGGLLFSSRRQATIRNLWWVAPGGRPLVQVTPATVDVSLPAVARNGKHAAFVVVAADVNLWRIPVDGDPVPRRLTDSVVPDYAGQYSPDGRHIVFQSDRSGNAEIWVADPDGSNPVRLTNGHGDELGNPQWSPDGSLIAFELHRQDAGGIFVMAPDGSGLRPVAVDSKQYRVPSWSHDGRFIYAVVVRGGQSEIWKLPVQGGPPAPVAHLTGMAPRESADGKSLYFFWSGAVWRAPLDSSATAAKPVKILDGLQPDADWGNWCVTSRGIYYIQRHEGAFATIDYIDFATRSVRSLYTMTRLPLYGGRGLALSSDAKYLLFSQVDRDDREIFLQ